MRAHAIRKWIVTLALVLVCASVAIVIWRDSKRADRRPIWKTAVSPGELSSPHAFLASNCSACHTPVKGVEAASCIACHANDQSLLQRQPTAFHADVQNCTACHREHDGTNHHPTQMDHAALAKLPLRQTKRPTTNASFAANRIVLASLIEKKDAASPLPPGHPEIMRAEAALNCAQCHSNEDRHRGLFGTDCIQCHTTSVWTISEFRHPSPTSTDCAQCHQAPPSHYMEHFHMVSMTVAGQHHAQVNQCYLCHQTNDWNDIKGVGWYKHH